MVRKKLETTGGSKMSRLVDRLNISKTGLSGMETASKLMERWNWIDFIDVKNGLPCLLLEWLFGCRGMLTGRFVKIEADPGIGKSSYLFTQYGMAQATKGAYCGHHETEGAPPPPDYIASLDCNPDELLIGQPRSIEECMENVENLVYEIRKDDPACKYPIVQGIDSVSGLGSNAEDEDVNKAVAATLGASGAGLAGHARVLSKWFRDRGCLWLTKFDVLLFATAQLKDNIVIGGPPGMQLPADQKKKTIADSVMNFNASYILRMKSSPLREKDTKKDIGELVKIRTLKNKVSPKHREVVIPLLRGQGFDFLAATADFLRFNSPITLSDGSVFNFEQRGAWLACDELNIKVPSNDKGKAELVAAVYAREDLLMGLREALKIRGFGFDFEKRYTPTKSEIEDLTPDEVE